MTNLVAILHLPLERIIALQTRKRSLQISLKRHSARILMPPVVFRTNRAGYIKSRAAQQELFWVSLLPISRVLSADLWLEIDWVR